MDDKDSEQRGRAIVQSLAVVVQSMLQQPDPASSAFTQRTKFEAFRAPNISIRDYLMRINKYASCSPECFVLALVYIDRLHSTQGLVLTELNVHRVLITSVVLAAKFFDDHYFNNAYYSKVGGVPCSEMNELEVEFLLMTNFTLHVTTDVYVRYYNELTNTYIFNNLGGPSVHQFRPFCVMDPKQQGQLIYVAESEVDGLALPMCEEEDQEYEEPPQPQNEQHPYYQQQYEHHYEQQQQQQQQQQQYDQQRQHFEQQQQAALAPVNGYQHGSHANSFAHTPHSVSSQQAVEEHHNQAPPRPVYVYQQPQHQAQQTNPYGASSKHSALSRHHVHDHQYHYAAPGSVQGYQHLDVGPYGTVKHAAPTQAHVQFPQHHDSNYHHVVSHPSHSQRSPMEDSYHRSSSASTGKYVSGLPPAPSGAVSSASSNGIVYSNSGRTSGQKRRKSIALGVNA